MRAFAAGRPLRTRLKQLLRKKEIIGDLCDQLRAGRARHLHHRAPGLRPLGDSAWMAERLSELLQVRARGFWLPVPHVSSAV